MTNTRYLALCRACGPAWCRYTLWRDCDRLPYWSIACLVQVGFFNNAPDGAEGDTK